MGLQWLRKLHSSPNVCNVFTMKCVGFYPFAFSASFFSSHIEHLKVHLKIIVLH